MITLQDLHPAKGSTHKAKRLGQGPGSGKGKTAGKDTRAIRRELAVEFVRDSKADRCH